MSANESNGRITVSEDKLYRALAEFENSIKGWLDDRLERKADLVMLTETRKKVDGLEGRVRTLEDARTEIQGVRRWWDSFWARLFGVGALVGALWWLPLHHG